MKSGPLHAVNPGGRAALAPWLEQLESQGWQFSATRGERGVTYSAERRSERGDVVRRFDNDLRRLVRRCTTHSPRPPKE